jgi:hypothetical protein
VIVSRPNAPLCTEDPDLWFSTSKADKAKAMSTCLDCPLVRECGEYGKTQHYGIWGGVEARPPMPEVPCRQGLHDIKGWDDLLVDGTGQVRCRPCRREIDRIGAARRRALARTESPSTHSKGA